MTQNIDQYVIVAMLPLALLSWVVARLWASRSKTPFHRGFVSLLSLSLILSVTIVGRMFELSSWGNGTLTVSWLMDSALWGDVIRLDRPWFLNVILFAPAGLTMALVFPKAIRVVVGLVGLSILIEFVQRWWMLGAADPADVIANCVGAAIGVASATVLKRASGQ